MTTKQIALLILILLFFLLGGVSLLFNAFAVILKVAVAFLVICALVWVVEKLIQK